MVHETDCEQFKSDPTQDDFWDEEHVMTVVTTDGEQLFWDVPYQWCLDYYWTRPSMVMFLCEWNGYDLSTIDFNHPETGSING